MTRPLWFVALVAVALAACGPERTLPGDPPPELEVVAGTESPSSGATGVPTDAQVRVKLSRVVAADSIAQAFTLSAGDARVKGTVFVEAPGDVLVFVPKPEVEGEAPLAPRTLHTAQVSRRLRDTFGRPLKQDYTWTFETGDGSGGGGGVPTLVAIEPAEGATGVPVRVKPRLRFSRAMDAASLETAVKLEDAGGTPLERTVTVSADGTEALVAPASALATGTTYQLRVTIAATSAEGVAVAEERRWSFTTSNDATHGAPLEVVSVTPAAGASDQVLRVAPTATFNRAIDPATLDAGSFVLRRTSDLAIVEGTRAWDAASRTVTLTPAGRLAPSATYEVVLDGLTSDEGLALVESYRWSFATTADPEKGEPPRVLSTTPAANATGVARTDSIVLEFSKPLDPASLGAASVAVEIGGAPVAATRSFAARTLTIDPAADLPYDSDVVVRLTAAVKDLEGLALAPFELRFRTGRDLAAPVVLSTDPSDGAIGVALNAAVRFTMSEAIAPASIRLAVTAGAAVPGNTGWDEATRTISFTPDSPYARQANVTATLSAASDLAGNALATPVVLQFRTGGTIDEAPPTFAGLASATPLGESSVRLAWAPASDALSPRFTYLVWVAKSPAAIDFSQPPSASVVDVTEHTVGLLEAGATYSFAVRAMDGAGNVETNTVTKQATLGDLTAPSFAGLSSLSPVAGETALLATWADATDNVSAASSIRYRVYLAEASGAQDFATPLHETAPGAKSDRIGSLVSGRTYFVVVRAVDAAGNESQSRVEKSAAVADTGAPAWPANAGVRLAATSRTSMRVSWDAAQDAVTPAAQLRYRIEKRRASEAYALDGEVVGALSRDVGGLVAGETYTFRVTAIDQAGNAAPNPNEPSDATDATPPAFPSGVQPQAVSPSAGKVDFSWAEATDAKSPPVEYLVFRTSGAASGVFSATPELVTATACSGGRCTKSFSSLAAGTWSFGVRARDAVGNTEANTATASVSVAAPPLSWTDVDAILSVKCSECHSFTYASVTSSSSTAACGGGPLKKLIVAGNPDQSALYLKVQGLCGSMMPPAGRTGLDASELTVLRDWILAGAVE